jgi:hypothetical protein
LLQHCLSVEELGWECGLSGRANPSTAKKSRKERLKIASVGIWFNYGIAIKWNDTCVKMIL